MSDELWKFFTYTYGIQLTHWGRVTHICVGKLTVIGSDNGLSPARRQAITWTNAGISLTGPLGTNFSEILIEILTFSFKKMRMKVSSAKRRPFCLSLNVLKSFLMLSSGFRTSLWLRVMWNLIRQLPVLGCCWLSSMPGGFCQSALTASAPGAASLMGTPLWGGGTRALFIHFSIAGGGT